MKLFLAIPKSIFQLLLVIAIAGAFAMTGRPQSATPSSTPKPAAPTQPSPSTVATKPADAVTVDSTLAGLYDVISGPAGKRDWDRFRSLFAPGARLIANGVRPTGEVVSRVMSVDDYAQRNGPYFEQNGFFEQEVSRQVDRFGNIAHVFSTYESRHAKDDAKPFARGINSIQLMNDGKRWWIVTVFWQGEDEKNPIPEKYLKGAATQTTPDAGTFRLDSRIPRADPREYLPITGAWKNPNVFVDLSGVYLTADNRSMERIEPVDNLICALLSLPITAWPHGRVATLSQSARIPILIKQPYYERAYKNLEQTEFILESLGIEIVGTPIN